MYAVVAKALLRIFTMTIDIITIPQAQMGVGGGVVIPG